MFNLFLPVQTSVIECDSGLMIAYINIYCNLSNLSNILNVNIPI